MEVTRPRARILTGAACFLAFTIAILVRVGLNDGGWPLFVPGLASAAAVLWPTRAVIGIAVACTAAIVVLGLMSVGILYGMSLALLISALAVTRSAYEKATA